MSDHFAVFHLCSQSQNSRNEIQLIQKRIIKVSAINKFAEQVATRAWDNVYNFSDAQEAYTEFCNNFTTTI